MTTQFSHGYALLIGVHESQTPAYALPTVAKDVDALRAVLTAPTRCAYPDTHVKTLTGAAASKQGILDGLTWLKQQVAADVHATALVYYSGHGWRDTSNPDDYYFIPYDTQDTNLRQSALRAADFAAAIDKLHPPRLLVVLDCCHAGGMGVKDATLPLETYTPAAAPLSLWPEMGGGKGLDALTVGRGRAVLSSSTGAQKSWFRLDGTLSIFTYHLIAALTGHAQPQAGAAEVLVSDVMSHVTRQVSTQVRAERQADQTPDFRVTGNFPVALLLGGKGLTPGQPAPDPLAAPAPAEPLTMGGIRANRIEAENVVVGTHVQGKPPENMVALLEAAAKIRTDGITAGEIKALNVVAGVLFANGRAPETTAALQQEIAALREQVQAALAAGEIVKRGDAQDVQTALDAAQTELAESQPDGTRVKRQLKTAADILNGIAEATQAAGKVSLSVLKLAPLAAMLWKLAEGLF